MLYKVVLTFESVDEVLKCDIQMKATEQQFVKWCCLSLSLDKILKCDKLSSSIFLWNCVHKTFKISEEFWLLILPDVLHFLLFQVNHPFLSGPTNNMNAYICLIV